MFFRHPHTPSRTVLAFLALAAAVAACEPVIPPCGDLHVGYAEQCDDGNTVDGDDCTSECRFPVTTCGNDTLEAPETCDDGNTTGGDGCSQFCTVESCGNGRWDVGEHCDDGNTLPGDGCSATCRVEAGWGCKTAPQVNSGSNGIGRQAPFGSDDLIWSISSTLEGAKSPAIVAWDCAKGSWVKPLAGATWITQQGCNGTSPGNADAFYHVTFFIPDDADPTKVKVDATVWADNFVKEIYVNGVATGLKTEGTTGFTGSGVPFGGWSSKLHKRGANVVTVVVHNAEGDADNPDGLLVSSPSSYSAASTCIRTVCGNNLVELGEACDDGDTAGGDGCSADCLSDETCGNWMVDTNESCDDGNKVGGDTCPADCAPPVCGNGRVDRGEPCDGGEKCAAGCKLVNGESCADWTNAACASDICDRTEATPRCEAANTRGNSVVESGEQCDDGNLLDGDDCSKTGRLEVCPNGVLDGNEECDDGNSTANDGCTLCRIDAGAVCTSSPNINTGTNLTGGVLPVDSQDLVWSWRDLVANESGRATVSANCAVGFWVDGTENASWITRYGCAQSSPPERDTTYTATFTIPTAAAASKTTIAGRIWADNYITDVKVNGRSTGMNNVGGTGFNGDGISFGSWSSTFYQEGVNTIDVVVHNAASEGGLNPDGLLVSVPGASGQGSTCSVP